MGDPRTSSDQFARVHGSPGEAPRLRGLLRVFLPLLAVMVAAGYLLRAAMPWPPLGPTAVGLLLILLAALLAAAARASRTRLESFLKGARGEEGVGRILARLPAAYEVFHGLAGGGEPGGDLDHVVVGPTGVFLVETKNWSGRVRVAEGRVLVDDEEPDRPPLEQTNRAADELRAYLRATSGPVAVQPILCFSGPGAPARLEGVGGVLVCSDRELLAAVQAQGEGPLAETQRARIAAALKQRLA